MIVLAEHLLQSDVITYGSSAANGRLAHPRPLVGHSIGVQQRADEAGRLGEEQPRGSRERRAARAQPVGFLAGFVLLRSELGHSCAAHSGTVAHFLHECADDLKAGRRGRVCLLNCPPSR